MKKLLSVEDVVKADWDHRDEIRKKMGERWEIVPLLMYFHIVTEGQSAADVPMAETGNYDVAKWIVETHNKELEQKIESE